MAQSDKRVFLVAGLMALASCGGETGGGESDTSPQVQSTGIGSGSLSGMSLGEIQEAEITSAGLDLDLSGANSSGEDQYLLVVNSSAETPDDYSLQLTLASLSSITTGLSALATGESPEESEESASSQFHQYLREMEEVMRQSEDFREVRLSSLSHLVSSPTQLAAGSEKTFRVLSTISSISTYKEVSATLRLATEDLYVYVDTTAAGHLSDEDIRTLANDFEDIALPVERDLFGRESDVNGDGHITILMTPVLNKMASSGGIVTGFFYPGDLYQRTASGSSALVNPVSNEGEIFYTMVPDPAGDFGVPISVNFTINNILPGVLAHEYQHMTSFNQHVFINGGSTEVSWLNECLAHLAEDLTGFGDENPSRAKLFLAQPAGTPLIPASSPTLGERGGCYLFLRYLYEQNPDGDRFLRRLFNSNLTGMANLEAAFAGTDPDFDEFPEWIRQWSIALALSETGVTADPRYNYQARSAHPQTGNFTGVCIRCDAQDGRGTVLSGPVMSSPTAFPSPSALKATATQFYQLVADNSHLKISGPDGAGLLGSLIHLKKK